MIGLWTAESVIDPAGWQPSKAQRSFKFGRSVAKTTSEIHLGPENSGYMALPIFLLRKKEQVSLHSEERNRDVSKEGRG